jgi:hypothetical protein
MSATELERLAAMVRLAERRTTQRVVAEQLGLTVRQVERLYAAYKVDGASSLVSRKRGAASNRQTPAEVRALALELVRGRYADFGPTLAHEKLLEVHGISISRSTVRAWMIGDGVWTTRRDRAKRAYQPRYRRSCFGELVQIDGCLHHWFEGRGPQCTVLVYVDDATSKLMELRFARSESTFDYFAATQSYLGRHGKPVAFYSDKASIFRVNAKDAKAGDGYTQFGRAMFDLNIEIICANSAPAKGRVERAHQTLQDRLVKELRLRDISTMAGANDYVPAFMADYNSRFARPAHSAHDAHRPVLAHDKLDRIFTWQEARRVTQNLTLHYKRVMYVLEPSKLSQAAANKSVLVRETNEGTVVIEFKGTALPARAFFKEARVDQGAIADSKVLGAALADVQLKQQARDARTLTSKRLTLRDEDLMRKAMGEPGLPARRGRPTIREKALARIAAETASGAAHASSMPAARVAAGSAIDELIAQTIGRLGEVRHTQASTPPLRTRTDASKR